LQALLASSIQMMMVKLTMQKFHVLSLEKVNNKIRQVIMAMFLSPVLERNVLLEELVELLVLEN